MDPAFGSIGARSWEIHLEHKPYCQLSATIFNRLMCVFFSNVFFFLQVLS